MADQYQLFHEATPPIYIHQHDLDYELLDVRFFLYGAGDNAVEFLTELAHANRPVFENVLCIADDDKAKQGTELLGIPIISLEALMKHPRLHPWDMYPIDTLVVITPTKTAFEMYHKLVGKGFTKITHYNDALAELISLSTGRHGEYARRKNIINPELKGKRVGVLRKHLGDEKSLSIFDATIEGYVNGNWGLLEKHYTQDKYVPDDIFKLTANEVIIDCGAYDLESLRTIVKQGGGLQICLCL
jgi:hypothetical protein